MCEKQPRETPLRDTIANDRDGESTEFISTPLDSENSPLKSKNKSTLSITKSCTIPKTLPLSEISVAEVPASSSIQLTCPDENEGVGSLDSDLQNSMPIHLKGTLAEPFGKYFQVQDSSKQISRTSSDLHLEKSSPHKAISQKSCNEHMMPSAETFNARILPSQPSSSKCTDKLRKTVQHCQTLFETLKHSSALTPHTNELLESISSPNENSSQARGTLSSPIKNASTALETLKSPIKNTSKLLKNPSNPIKNTSNTLEISSSSIENSSKALETSSSPIENMRKALENPSIPIENSSKALETPSIPIENSSKALETSSIPIQHSSNTLEISSSPIKTTSTALEISSSSIKTTSMALETSSSSIKNTSKVLENPSIPIENSSKAIGTSSSPIKDSSTELEISNSPIKNTITATGTSNRPNENTSKALKMSSSPIKTPNTALETSSRPIKNTSKALKTSSSSSKVLETPSIPIENTNKALETSSSPIKNTSKVLETPSSPIQLSSNTLETPSSSILHTKESLESSQRSNFSGRDCSPEKVNNLCSISNALPEQVLFSCNLNKSCMHDIQNDVEGSVECWASGQFKSKKRYFEKEKIINDQCNKKDITDIDGYCDEFEKSKTKKIKSNSIFGSDFHASNKINSLKFHQIENNAPSVLTNFSADNSKAVDSFCRCCDFESFVIPLHDAQFKRSKKILSPGVFLRNLDWWELHFANELTNGVQWAKSSLNQCHVSLQMGALILSISQNQT